MTAGTSPGGDPESRKYADIRKSLTTKLLEAQSADDAEKFSAALKSVTEAATAKESLDIQRASISIERLKSWVTVVVPVVSVLGLTATLWTQSAQIRSTRDTTEDAQWTSTLAALTSVGRNPADGFSYVARVKPFLRNERYAGVARDVAVVLLGKIVDPATFDDLFHATFPKPVVSDIPLLVRISRALNHNWDADKAALDRFDSSQGPPVQGPAMPATAAPPRAPVGASNAGQRDALQNAQSELYKEMGVVNSTLADLLRARKSNDTLDLTEIWFSRTDLHAASLRNADFGLAAISQVNLSGADLHGVHAELFLPDVRWWRAQYLEKDVLETLVKTSYPYKFNEASYNGVSTSYAESDAVTREDYKQGVVRLCSQLSCDIDTSHLAFGPMQPATVAK